MIAFKGESELRPKIGVSIAEKDSGDNYTFKPKLYKDPFKGKVKSVIRAEIDQHSKVLAAVANGQKSTEALQLGMPLQPYAVDERFGNRSSLTLGPKQLTRAPQINSPIDYGSMPLMSMAIPEQRRARLMNHLNNHLLLE